MPTREPACGGACVRPAQRSGQETRLRAEPFRPLLLVQRPEKLVSFRILEHCKVLRQLPDDVLKLPDKSGNVRGGRPGMVLRGGTLALRGRVEGGLFRARPTPAPTSAPKTLLRRAFPLLTG